ncbi:MAG: HNH endonuclease signature motif containing protein [Cytophagales bacterium]|nr:HNH endonuclease signature motif containing protein [Cytophagales bacterium]
MSDYTEKEIEEIWKKAEPAGSPDPINLRTDPCGAWIKKDQYGEKTEYGWSVDHAFPKKNGGTDDLENLRPMQHKNNSSKGYDYPAYVCAITSKGSKNIERDKRLRISDSLQKTLKDLGMS